jgi:plasmid stabilization system protein ParE
VTRKPVVPRAAANRDIEGIIEFYLAEGGGQTVQQFVAALEQETRVEIWRVLHGHRDIPQWLGPLVPRDRDQ